MGLYRTCDIDALNMLQVLDSTLTGCGFDPLFCKHTSIESMPVQSKMYLGGRESPHALQPTSRRLPQRCI